MKIVFYQKNNSLQFFLNFLPYKKSLFFWPFVSWTLPKTLELVGIRPSSTIIFDFLWQTALKKFYACPNNDCLCVCICLSVCKHDCFLLFFFLFHLENNSFFSLWPAGSVVCLPAHTKSMGVSFNLLKHTFVASLKLFPMISWYPWTCDPFVCVRVLFLIIIESSPVRKVLTISHCSKVNLINFGHVTRVEEHVS